jgi:hypothetical protein
LRKRRITFASIEDQKMSDEDERNIYDYFSAIKKKIRIVTDFGIGATARRRSGFADFVLLRKPVDGRNQRHNRFDSQQCENKNSPRPKKVYSILQETLKEEIYNLL